MLAFQLASCKRAKLKNLWIQKSHCYTLLHEQQWRRTCFCHVQVRLSHHGGSGSFLSGSRTDQSEDDTLHFTPTVCILEDKPPATGSTSPISFTSCTVSFWLTATEFGKKIVESLLLLVHSHSQSLDMGIRVQCLLRPWRWTHCSEIITRFYECVFASVCPRTPAVRGSAPEENGCHFDGASNAWIASTNVTFGDAVPQRYLKLQLSGVENWVAVVFQS